MKFFVISIRKKLFGERFAVFRFGFDDEIRKIRTDAEGNEYCWAYGYLIAKPTTGWREI